LKMAFEYRARFAKEAFSLSPRRVSAQSSYWASSAKPTEWFGASPMSGPSAFQ
jgi:hypothetical protein